MYLACLPNETQNNNTYQPSDKNQTQDAEIRDNMMAQDWYLISYTTLSPNNVTLKKKDVFLTIRRDGTYEQNLYGEIEQGKWSISDDGLYLRLRYQHGGGVDIIIKKLSQNKLILVREKEHLELTYEPALG